MSYHTVNRYVDILKQTFLVRRLPPYFANPEIYFRDTCCGFLFPGKIPDPLADEVLAE